MLHAIANAESRDRLSGTWIAYLLGAAVFAAWAVWAGQDANWDLQNYHVYAPYALLHRRYGLDVGAAGFQAYLNPLPYLIPYGLRATLPPVWAAVALAALQAVVVPVAWALTGALPGLVGRPALRALATLLGCTASTALSEVGTSFADLPLTPLVLGGLLAALQADRPGSRAGRPMALAGLLIGAAIGFKLTNAIFAFGLGAAVLAGGAPIRATIRAGLCAAAGLAVGALLVDGLWAFQLWRQFGNPIFPGLNTLFHSTSADLRDFTDLRFLPHSLAEALAYPALIALGRHPSAEIAFAEPRYLLAIPLALAAGAYRAAARQPCRAEAFLLAAFLAWLGVFGIERYAVAIEMLAGIVLVADLALFAGTRARPGARSMTAICAVTAAAVLAATRPADWWHRPWSDAYRPVLPTAQAPALAQPAVFLAMGYPTGYWAPVLPRGSRIYGMVPTGLATGGVLHDRIVRGLADAPGSRVWMFGVDLGLDAATRARLATFGYAPAAPCARAPSFVGADTVFCRAVPAGARPMAAADLLRDAPADFSRTGAGWIYEVSGWANASREGTPSFGPLARLALRPDPAVDHPVLEFALIRGAYPAQVVQEQDPALPLSPIRVTVNGAPARPWPAAPTTATICVPARAVADIGLEDMAGQPLRLVMQSLRLRSARPDECPDQAAVEDRARPRE